MKILSLYLKNMLPVLSTLEKYEISLDFTGEHEKELNIFIGKMGSCKTFILGHLQPYATMGTLDVRNGTDMIIPEKTGVKEIVFRDGIDEYAIRHVYTPTKTSHTIKSFIRKNGKELNMNGNTTSFKAIVETEMDIDQNYLRLFRIGANVANVLNMKAAERKSFISSMLSETETYLMLYKKVGEDVRNLNSKAVVLTTKLKQITDRTPEQMQIELDEDMEIAANLQKEADATSKKIYQIEANITNALQGMNYVEFQKSLGIKEERQEAMKAEIDALQEKVDACKDMPSMRELNRLIGSAEATVQSLRQNIMDLEMKVKADTDLLNSLLDKQKIVGSAEHIETLRLTYAELCATKDTYEKQLRGFSYTGSRASIESLMGDLTAITQMITDVAQYKPEAISKIIKNPKSAIAYAKSRTEILTARKMKLQNLVGNAKYVEDYIPPCTMFRPPNCPTETCPYYQHHPYTEKMKSLKDPLKADEQFIEQRNEISQLDAEIYLLNDYPYIASKLQTLTENWNRVVPILRELGVLREDSLLEVITNLMSRTWYDEQKLQRIREQCGIREKYYELTEHIASMKNELSQYDASDSEELYAKISETKARLDEETADLEQAEADLDKTQETLEGYNENYLILASLEEIKKSLEGMIRDYEELSKEIDSMEGSMKMVVEQVAVVEAAKARLETIRKDHKTYLEDAQGLRTKLQDYNLTMAQYEDTIKDYEIAKDIQDAVSAKKGIPLIFVKNFLQSSREIINDLIADVFSDKIEIQEFDIPEDGSEFNIPYTKNGVWIDDIEAASQGERSVISLALSFALIRQRVFRYNIMLLDEVDAPLHKSDRESFLAILFKQLKVINAEQVFLITHNNTFDGYPNVNIIMTTDEVVDETPGMSVMHV